MTVLAHLPPPGPQPEPRAGWECPRCLTVYNPDVKACHCATSKPLSERLKQDRAIRLGGGLIGFPDARCTCPQLWGAIIPPPCPAHGQTEMLRVTC